MSIAISILESMNNSSWIRKMFEEGIQLKQKFGVDNVFDFSLGNPDLPPPDEFFNAIKDIALKHESGSLLNEHGYMSNAGYPETREAIAGKIATDHGISISGNNIIMTCGAAGGLNVVMKTILNPGEEVIVPKPYFFEYGAYVANHNGKLVLVDSANDFSLDINAIRSAINDKTKAILINSPNNPTGKVYSEQNIMQLSGLLSEQGKIHGKDIYLISDEPYTELVYDGIKVPSILKCYKNSIMVTSYSKSLSIAGERIGYIAANPSCTDINNLISGLVLCNRILGYVNAPAIMQKVITRLLNHKVDTEIYKKRRDLFIDGLKKAGYKAEAPEGAFYIFPESPLKDDVKFVQHLLKYNILAVPGIGFGGPGFFRLSYAVPENVIEKSLPKFKEAIESL